MSINEPISEPQCSERKLEANRENAKKSTGPRTEEGKIVVSQNATKHGLLSRSLKFENEQDRESFEHFRSEMFLELQPQGMIETMVVEGLVNDWTKLLMAQRWSSQELYYRRKAAIAILRASLGSPGCGLSNNPFDPPDMDGESGLDLRELTIKVAPRTRMTHEILQNREGAVQFQAKLGTSAETLLRYEAALKKDLSKSLEMLRSLQRERKANLRERKADSDPPKESKSGWGNKLSLLKNSIFKRD